MAQILSKVWSIFTGSFDQTALLQGTSDIVVVKWDSGHYRSSPFLVCFGPLSTIAQKNKVNIFVNNVLIQDIYFTLDQYGYLHPMRPSQEFIGRLNLKEGRNSVVFELDKRHKIQSEVYLYDQHDKIIVSDVDGTLTKDDLGGLYNNYYGKNYLHQGYNQLINALDKKNIKVVWLTMRSLPLYNFSKQYIHEHTRINGPLMTQPEEFLTAMKKQVTKNTGGIKTMMLQTIVDLFPKDSNPLIGGLGNRDNDAIAYRAAGINVQNIFIVDTFSNIHHFGNPSKAITYHQISQSLEKYFKLPPRGLQRSLTLQNYDSPMPSTIIMRGQSYGPY